MDFGKLKNAKLIGGELVSVEGMWTVSRVDSKFGEIRLGHSNLMERSRDRDRESNGNIHTCTSALCSVHFTPLLVAKLPLSCLFQIKNFKAPLGI